MMEKQKGKVIIERDTMIMGDVDGSVVVLPGARLDLKAKVTGNVTLKKFSKVSILGQVDGNVFDEGAQIELLSKVKGEIIKK